jgi:hypothetical protein
MSDTWHSPEVDDNLHTVKTVLEEALMVDTPYWSPEEDATGKLTYSTIVRTRNGATYTVSLKKL